MSRPAPAAAPIEYPSGDGQRMADDGWQLSAMMYAISVLRIHFRDRPDVYVGGDLLIYYEEGEPRERVAPDVFVAFGVDKHIRQNYLLWEEGRPPTFVLEVVSAESWRDALTWKRRLYARLGVQEYWQYDPQGFFLQSRLQGERLTARGYSPQPVVEDQDGALTMRSVTLDLELYAAPGKEMRFRIPATGKTLPSYDEEREGRLAEAAGRRAEAAQRRAAEERAETAEAARRNEPAGRRAEAAGRKAAEARVAELEAQLRGRERRD